MESLSGEKNLRIVVTLALEFISTLTLQGNFPCTPPHRNSALLKLSKALFITPSDKWLHGIKMCSCGFSSCWLVCNSEPPRHMAKSCFLPEPKTCIGLIWPEGIEKRGPCLHKSVVDVYVWLISYFYFQLVVEHSMERCFFKTQSTVGVCPPSLINSLSLGNTLSFEI